MRPPPSGLTRAIIGIDPGLTKCGYAAISPDGHRLTLEVVPATELTVRLERELSVHDVCRVCVGDATMSERIVRQIRSRWPEAPITMIDESNTTLEARRLYYKDHPPRGLLRLIPRGLLVPKEPLDGYAALLIAQRYLGIIHTVNDHDAPALEQRPSGKESPK